MCKLSIMRKKRVLVGYGVDIDAVAGWLGKVVWLLSCWIVLISTGSYKGEDSTSDISRGVYEQIVRAYGAESHEAFLLARSAPGAS